MRSYFYTMTITNSKETHWYLIVLFNCKHCISVIDCGQHGYGTTYQEERGAALKGLNNLIQTQVSLEECILLCSKESSFICRSVEYNSGTRSCHLSVETLYTKSDERYKLAPDGWDYFYTRDCN